MNHAGQQRTAVAPPRARIETLESLREHTPQSGPTGEALLVDFAGVRPMRPNPRLADHPLNSPIRTALQEFNRTYCTLLQSLDQAFNGWPKTLGPAIRTMYALKSQAQGRMELPDGDGSTAGPTFEYVEPELRR